MRNVLPRLFAGLPDAITCSVLAFSALCFAVQAWAEYALRGTDRQQRAAIVQAAAQRERPS